MVVQSREEGEHHSKTLSSWRNIGVILSLFSLVLVGLSMSSVSHRWNTTLMRIFRDIGRYKARKRLYGKTIALVPFFLHQEDPLSTPELERIQSTAVNNEKALQQGERQISFEFTLTVEELGKMDGRTEGTPMFLAVNDYIFDVSSAPEKYGPGSNYHSLVGRNATLAFANACFEERCFTSTADLKPGDYEDLNYWVEFFTTHDKYPYVGRLIRNPVDVILEQEYPS